MPDTMPLPIEAAAPAMLAILLMLARLPRALVALEAVDAAWVPAFATVLATCTPPVAAFTAADCMASPAAVNAGVIPTAPLIAAFVPIPRNFEAIPANA